MMPSCPVCGQLHAPNCLRSALEDLKARPVFKQPEPHCPFCGYPRADGMQTHSFDCEWCTLVQRIGRIEYHQADIYDVLGKLCGILETKHGSDEEPDTQRSGSPRVLNDDGLSERTLESLGWVDRGVRLPPYPGGALTNPGAAEPAGEAPAGAVPSGSQPERAG
jgi:hypothetical protein